MLRTPPHAKAPVLTQAMRRAALAATRSTRRRPNTLPVLFVAICTMLVVAPLAPAFPSGFVTPLAAQSLEEVDPTEEIDAAVTAAAADGSFAGVVLVREAGREVYFRAIGDAVREFDVPHERSTRFKYHSLSKPLLGTLFHTLKQDGVVAEGDSVCRHLTPCPDAWRGVTLRQLLRHTSGIPELENEWYSNGRGELETAWQMIFDADHDWTLVTEPGTTFRYSNGGYTLVALILERATGETLSALMTDRVFEPAGMTDAGIEAAPDPDVAPWYRGPAVIDRLANGYNGTPGRIRTAYSLMYTIPGAGAAYGTADDLANFAEAVFAGGLLEDGEVEAMLHVDPEPNPRYANGWVVSERAGARVRSHTGGNNGFLSSLDYYPETRTVVVILSNLGFTDLRGMTDAIGEAALAGR